jgi:hypothetical protein
MSISDGGPGEIPAAETNPAEAVARTAAETKVAMQFTAAFWRYTVQLNRAGREEGDAIHVPGKLVAQIPDSGEKTWPTEVTIIKKDPKLRLDLRILPERAEITVPLEDFALARLTEKLKEYVSGYGMTLQIGFAAEAHEGRQILEAVDFAFSSEKLDV